MGVSKNGTYKVYNGTDFDTINLKTIAGNVSIADAGSKITATDVEGALQELATNIALKLNSSAYTASDVLAKLLTVDGASSLIDADKLDNKEGSAYWADTDTTQNIGSSGYIKFKNGLMIQWGHVSCGGLTEYASSAFYTTFPTGCFNCVVSGEKTDAHYATSVRCDGFTNSTFAWSAWQNTTPTATTYINFIAFGY